MIDHAHAQEFLRRTLDVLHEELASDIPPLDTDLPGNSTGGEGQGEGGKEGGEAENGSEKPNQDNRKGKAKRKSSIILDIFAGKVVSEVKCSVCGKVRVEWRSGSPHLPLACPSCLSACSNAHASAFKSLHKRWDFDAIRGLGTLELLCWSLASCGGSAACESVSQRSLFSIDWDLFVTWTDLFKASIYLCIGVCDRGADSRSVHLHSSQEGAAAPGCRKGSGCGRWATSGISRICKKRRVWGTGRWGGARAHGKWRRRRSDLCDNGVVIVSFRHICAWRRQSRP